MLAWYERDASWSPQPNVRRVPRLHLLAAVGCGSLCGAISVLITDNPYHAPPGRLCCKRCLAMNVLDE